MRTMFSALCGLLVGAGLAVAAAKEFKATCPVSGNPATKEAVVDFEGKKVYFCCENCPAAFKKDEAKFTAKAHYQFAQTGEIKQVACPFSGSDLNADTKIKIKDVEVAFCCEKCQAKAKDAADPVALVFGDIKKGFTKQTTCPISGKPIDVSVKAEHDGKKVYFCCPGCPPEFAKDPKKYAEKL
ncbi:MAG: hypothetical protein ACRC1K_21090 [Planctomycetia bacterium]